MPTTLTRFIAALTSVAFLTLNVSPTTLPFAEAGDQQSETTIFIGKHYEIRPAGTTIKYIFAGDQLIAAVFTNPQTGARSIQYIHPDHLGSTNLVTDEAAQVVARTEYAPYGTTSVQVGAAGIPQQFTGQRFDASTDLHYYNARYYDSQLGRFIQADTIVPAPGDPQALNRYSYVRNNPVKYVDPSGHSWWTQFSNWLKEHRWDVWNQNKPRPDDPGWWFRQLQPQGPVAPGTTQQFNQAISAAATFMVNQWGFSPAAANATIGAALAIPTGGNSLIAAGLAYGTTELLGTGEARQLIGSLAGFFEQFGVSPEASRTLATQVVSTGVSVAVAVASSTARELYVKVVRYQPTWVKGGVVRYKAEGQAPINGMNNIGVQGRPLNSNSLFNEGGLISRLANQIPGINAVSGMHDMFQINLNRWGGTSLGWALNVPGMPPAAALTYFALLRSQEVSAIYGVGSYGAQDN